MALSTTKLTADELETFPDDGRRQEIIDGELFKSPAPERAHQTIAARITEIVVAQRQRTESFEWFPGPVDVRFSETDQVQPDLVVLLNENLGAYRGHTVWGAPDLVVEIISPSSRTYDLVAKRGLYLRGGVPEYWIIDWTNHSLEICNLDGDRYTSVVTTSDRAHSRVLPDLKIDVDALFEKLFR